MRFVAALLVFAAALSAEVRIGGNVKTPFSLDSLSRFSTTNLTVTQKSQAGTYPAALLADILKRAGATFDESMTDRALHAQAMTSCVLVTAGDGYQVVFSLSELDPKNSKADIRIAAKPDHSFFLSVPSDLTRARNVRDVKTITVVRLGVKPVVPAGVGTSNTN